MINVIHSVRSSGSTRMAVPASAVLQPLTKVVCLLSVLYNVYVNYFLYLCTQIRGQDHLTVLVKISCPTDQVVLHNRYAHTACMHAHPCNEFAMLTLLLACSPPLPGCCIIYILSQDCTNENAVFRCASDKNSLVISSML